MVGIGSAFQSKFASRSFEIMNFLSKCWLQMTVCCVGFHFASLFTNLSQCERRCMFLFMGKWKFRTILGFSSSCCCCCLEAQPITHLFTMTKTPHVTERETWRRGKDLDQPPSFWLCWSVLYPAMKITISSLFQETDLTVFRFNWIAATITHVTRQKSSNRSNE